MVKPELANRFGWYIAIGSFVATVALTPTFSTEPANLIKFLTLQVIGFGALFVVLINLKQIFINDYKLTTFVVSFFVLGLCLTLILSGSPINQQLFGVYGRNTGFLTYLSLALIFLAIINICNNSIPKLILASFISAAIVNVIYGFIQYLNLDPFEWQNLYTKVFGTLGNPNFVAAFLGMAIGPLLLIALLNQIDAKFRILSAFLISLNFFVIIQTKAWQGVVVATLEALLASALVVIFKYRQKLKLVLTIILLLTISILTFLFFTGLIQKALSRQSIKVRIFYWEAAINIFKANPLYGTGMDSFGDNYRSYRSLDAVNFNSGIVSNSAHNVFLDLLANGGLLLLIPYLIIIGIALKSSYSYLIRMEKFDWVFVSIFVAWIGYLLQSSISINNIGLAIWGWVFPSVIIKLGKSNLSPLKSASKRSKELKNVNRSSFSEFGNMFLSIGIIIGFIIGYLPFKQDSNLRYLIESGNLNALMKNAKSYPQTTTRYIYVSKILDENNKSEDALALAKESLEFNSKSFEAWRNLFNLKSATVSDREIAMRGMKSLDPLNKEIAT